MRPLIRAAPGFSSTKTERLSGYLRQPVPFEPKAGMRAEIRTRGTPQKSAATTITRFIRIVGLSEGRVSPRT